MQQARALHSSAGVLRVLFVSVFHLGACAVFTKFYNLVVSRFIWHLLPRPSRSFCAPP